jgi:hypothetical protein
MDAQGVKYFLLRSDASRRFSKWRRWVVGERGPLLAASLNAAQRLVRRLKFRHNASSVFRAVLGTMSLFVKFEPLLILIAVKQLRLQPLI